MFIRCEKCGKKFFFVPHFFVGGLIIGLGTYYISSGLLDFLAVFIFLWAMYYATFFDILYMAVPNLFLFSASAGAIMHSIATNKLVDGISGATLAFIILYFSGTLYKLLRKKEGLGSADIIFTIPLGLFLGLKQTILCLFFSALLSSFWSILLLLRRKSIKTEFPLFPFISFSFIIVMIINDLDHLL